MSDEDIVSSPNAVAMNVACPVCHAGIAQHCMKLPLPRAACLLLDCSCGDYLPLGEVHAGRQRDFLKRSSGRCPNIVNDHRWGCKRGEHYQCIFKAGHRERGRRPACEYALPGPAIDGTEYVDDESLTESIFHKFEEKTPMPRFRPLYDHVMIRPDKAQEKIGSIYIPDSAQKKAMEGTVIAVGRGICNFKNGSWKELSVRVGDRVLFSSEYTHQSANEVVIDDEKFLVLREDDLGAVIDP